MRSLPASEVLLLVLLRPFTAQYHPLHTSRFTIMITRWHQNVPTPLRGVANFSPFQVVAYVPLAAPGQRSTHC